MAKIFSKEDLELLGYINIGENKSLSSTNQPWRIFNAEAVAGIQKVKHIFAYLQASCTKQDAKNLAKLIKVSSNFFIITPQSGLSNEALKSIFGRDSQIAIYEDLIWEKIQTIFQEYVCSLGTEITTEEYYVTPRSEDAKSSRDRLDDAIISYLEGQKDVGRISVVSASAGVGKTTLSRYVVKKLAEISSSARVIPTYVESSHWRKFPLESVEDIWQIIDNSLSRFSSHLKITEDLFKYALKQGYLVFIFDGFDELCGQRESHFNARDVLDWLIDIVRGTDARIVITTRTLFWDKEVGETPEYTVLQRLRTFETQQAKDYFHKFFPGDKESSNMSVSLYKQLIKKSQRPREQGGGRVQFVNLPLCVGMIARFVKEGGNSLTIGDNGTIIEQFLTQVLERERARQNLKTSAKQQLDAFEEIAVDCVKRGSEEFSLELLPVAGFIETDISRLIVHPFLRTTDNKEYRFSYAFLESYLLASYLAKHISTISVNNRSVWPIMELAENGKSYVIEHLVELLGPDSLENIGKCYHSALHNSGQTKSSRSFLFHVANIMVEERSDLVTIKEKTDTLLEIIGGTIYGKKRILEHLFVVGTVGKLDFSGVTIRKSEFHSVAFHKCKADNHTRFVDCKFSGALSFEESDKKIWAQVVLDENCNCESPTNLVWEGILNLPVSGKDEHIKDALRLALEKFWRHGRIKVSIRKQYWSKGTLGIPYTVNHYWMQC